MYVYMYVFAYTQIPHDRHVNCYIFAIVVYWNEPKYKNTFQLNDKHITSYRILCTICPEISSF